ncbi:hypothetical protein AVEN_258206-1 [Araneus ventricosus]|uniref:Uncharacterized protein n=1 Tax=Araneus ventricosus TaxID=182803 RepID=A0A4Y2IEB4_ARAVE|nr:hypothetical protein AVEN_258206-1 [Araneus ventricosus]
MKLQWNLSSTSLPELRSLLLTLARSLMCSREFVNPSIAVVRCALRLSVAPLITSCNKYLVARIEVLVLDVCKKPDVFQRVGQSLHRIAVVRCALKLSLAPLITACNKYGLIDQNFLLLCYFCVFARLVTFNNMRPLLPVVW